MPAQDEQKSEVRHLEICPSGDMEISLQSGADNVTYRYQVSSLQLCACSSVFRAMLGPKSSFAEAVELRKNRLELLETDSLDTKELYKLEVEDHDPTALAAVFSVIHTRTKNLPDNIPFEGLLQIAIICDYYDCAAAMRPWDDMWMKPWKGEALTPGFESWLFIARVFEEYTVFENLCKRLVRNSIVDDGEFKVLISKEAGARVVKKLPSHISQEILLKQRKNMCQELVKLYREVYDRYEDNTKTHCIHSKQSKLCDYFIFGELHKELKASNLLNEVKHHEWTPEYIVTTVETILNTIFDHLCKPARFDGEDHQQCGSFRATMINYMKYTLEDLVPLSWTSTEEYAGVREKSWDNLLLPSNERKGLEEIEAEKS